MKNLLLLIGLAAVFFACSEKAAEQIQSTESTPVDNNMDTVNSANDDAEQARTVQRSTRELLQGKWQHTEDRSNFLVFEGNLRKEIAEGMNEWDIEEFILSDTCANETDSNSELEKDADKYISCMNSDMCWYIIKVNEKELILSYVGRGNTLRYKRLE